jgi:hypothetical protein
MITALLAWLSSPGTRGGDLQSRLERWLLAGVCVLVVAAVAVFVYYW